MKILLFNPAIKYYTRAIANPLGLLSVATDLQNHGHTVRIVDRCVEKVRLTSVLRDFAPDVVGVTLMSGRGVKDARRIADEAHKRGLPVFCGGYFPSMSPQVALRGGLADIVIVGEGEITWRELTQRMDAGESFDDIAGIAYLRDGEVVHTPQRPFADLAELPILDWSLLDPRKYFQVYFHCSKMLYLYSSKGCPGHCTFCSNAFYNRSTFRKRPNDYVLDEIETLIRDYGMDGVYFTGELWNQKKSDAYDFCRKIHERGLRFHWGMLSRVGQYTREDYQTFYDAGCRFVFFGVETGCPEMQKRIEKNLSLDRAKQTFADCDAVGLTSLASFMIGLPDETPAQMRQTIDFMRSIPASILLVYRFSPLQNTKIYDEAVAAGRIRSDSADLRRYRRYVAMENPDVNLSQIPVRDMKVVKAYFDWRGFTSKRSVNRSRGHAFALQTIRNGLKSISGKGIVSFFVNGWKAFVEFSNVWFYAHMFPSVRKKYGLYGRTL